jgi:outer membrane immunogenic protein
MLAGVFVLGIASNAFGAAPKPLNDWTGFYAGGNIGYGWENTSPGIVGNTPVLAALITVNSIPASLSTNPKGWLSGLQLGYNYGINKIVVGMEADFSLADIEGNASTLRPGPILPFATYTTSVEQRLKWFATTRGRVGFTPLDNLLLFGTGGFAFGRIDYSGNIHRSAILVNFDVPASASATKTGWTIGGGAEYALTNKWSVKSEYLYYDLGGATLTGFQTPRPLVLAVNSASYSFVTRGSIVRVGFNYKFH